MTRGRVALLVLLLVLSGSAIIFADQWLSASALDQKRDWLLAQTEAHFLLVYVLYGLIYILATAVGLPGATLLSLLAGLLFGRWFATLLVVIAASSGALIIFLIARYLVAAWARERVAQLPAAQKMVTGFGENAFSYLLFLRLVPLFPFWLVNLAPAITPTPASTYFLATLIGITPGAFVFVNLGASLGRIEGASELISAEVLMALSLLGVLALLPIAMKRYSRQSKVGTS